MVLDAAVELRFLFQAVPASCVSPSLFLSFPVSFPSLSPSIYDSFPDSASSISVFHCFCLSLITVSLSTSAWLACFSSVYLSVFFLPHLLHYFPFLPTTPTLLLPPRHVQASKHRSSCLLLETAPLPLAVTSCLRTIGTLTELAGD